MERRRRRQWHARADGLGRGGAATAWAAAALSARARRLCAARARSGAQGSVAARGNAAARARSGAQGSVAARGNAAAVASRRAARARRGGQVIGRRVMGRRVTAPSDRSEPIVARPQLTSKACGARLSVSEGGRHVARREDDKCASYGSLFIGQSSGDGSVGQGEGRCGPVRPARFVARYGSRPNKFGRSVDAPKNQLDGKGATGAPNSRLAGQLMFS